MILSKTSKRIRLLLFAPRLDNGDTSAGWGYLAEYLDLVPVAQGGEFGSHLGAESLQGLHDGVMRDFTLLLQGFQFDGMRFQIGRYQVLDRCRSPVMMADIARL